MKRVNKKDKELIKKLIENEIDYMESHMGTMDMMSEEESDTYMQLENLLTEII